MESFIFDNKTAHFIDGTLIYDGASISGFKGVKESKEYLQGLAMSIQLEQKEVNTLKDSTIALVISESGEMKPSSNTIKDFRALIEGKHFFPSNALLHFRKEDTNFPGKIEYTMRNGESILLDLETNTLLNTVIDIKECYNLVHSMTETPESFMSCVYDILEDH